MSQSSNQYLASEKISTLMVKFSVPCILSLLVSSLYNIVDQIFIGRGIGYLGNGATNVVFPITIIALAVALMIGDGCAAFLSLCQGQNDTERSHKSVGNAVTVSILCGILLAVVFFAAKEPILRAFGATENNIAYAREYFDYIVPGIPFFVFGNAMNSIIRADGSPAFAMFSTLIGCVINVICDPIAIFGLHWGMRGAALATIFGQIVTAVLSLGYLTRSRSFRLTRTSFIPHSSLLSRFLALGISSFLTQLSIVVIMGVMNTTLVTYGAQTVYGSDIPLTVVGIVMKVFQILIAVAVGIAAGLQPVVGFNYGAGNYARVKQIYKTMMIVEIAVGLVATLCFELFPLQITQLFGSESSLYNEFAIVAFRTYLCTVVLCCVQKSTSIFLQSIGSPVLSMGLSLLRDFVLSVPLVLLLPRVFGLRGALYSAPIADIVSFLAVLVIMPLVFRGFAQKEKHRAADLSA